MLDPQAKKLLDPEEASNAEAIVIGGILGDNPPRGRTRKLLTSRFKEAKPRSLGPYQFSIDGAVYVATMVAKGLRPTEIEIEINPTIEIDLGEYGSTIIELPYAYPVVKGKPLISPELLEHIRLGLGVEELRLQRGQVKKCF